MLLHLLLRLCFYDPFFQAKIRDAELETASNADLETRSRSSWASAYIDRLTEVVGDPMQILCPIKLLYYIVHRQRYCRGSLALSSGPHVIQCKIWSASQEASRGSIEQAGTV